MAEDSWELCPAQRCMAVEATESKPGDEDQADKEAPI